MQICRCLVCVGCREVEDCRCEVRGGCRVGNKVVFLVFCEEIG